jgi:threonyl-tRNA synthetase
VVVLPVGEAQARFAGEVLAELKRAGLRATLDARNDAPRDPRRGKTLSRRIAEAHEASVPFIAVVGAREAEARSVTLRPREGAQVGRPLAEAVANLARECASPFAEAR